MCGSPGSPNHCHATASARSSISRHPLKATKHILRPLLRASDSLSLDVIEPKLVSYCVCMYHVVELLVEYICLIHLESDLSHQTRGCSTLSGLSLHRNKTCALTVRCLPVTVTGAVSRVTGAVLKTPTRGLPVMNPTEQVQV
jgi:hypothetical protein